jgi:hypothetical protein
MKQKKEGGSWTPFILVMMLVWLMTLTARSCTPQNPPSPEKEYVMVVDRLVFYNLSKEDFQWRIDCELYNDSVVPTGMLRINASFFLLSNTHKEISRIDSAEGGIPVLSRIRYTEFVPVKEIDEIVSEHIDNSTVIKKCIVKARITPQYTVWDEGYKRTKDNLCYIDEGQFNCIYDQVDMKVRCDDNTPTLMRLEEKFMECLKSFVEEE